MSNTTQARSSGVEVANKERDAAFNKAMHGTSSEVGGLRALLGKDKEATKEAVDEYFRHWDVKQSANETEEDRQARLSTYATLTKHYYNLATDFYEFAWGTSFHFCRFYPGEPFRQAIARHEHYLAMQIGIKPTDTVLDVGCGVGGPAREISLFTGCKVIGLNNNDYQIDRANYYAKKFHLEDKTKFVKGDFMQMDFAPDSFDAVYAIEATVHAPSLEGVYGQIFKVLKPGGIFGVYEWVMTDKYNENDPKQREICYAIEIGDGIPKMVGRDVAEAALKAVGFEVLKEKDLAQNNDEIPWYYPLSGDFKYCRSVSDLLTVFRTSRVGRFVTYHGVGLLEKVGLAPSGSQRVSAALEEAAIGLVDGAKMGIFTPMMLYVARKPAAKTAAK